jgi:hypothetical protein
LTANHEVVDAWLTGSRQWNRSLMTDGTSLYSYDQVIATLTGKKEITLPRLSYSASRTVRRHQALAERRARQYQYSIKHQP